MNRGQKIEAAFNKFDAANPAFWKAWCNRCQVAIQKRYSTYGAQKCMEEARWDWKLITVSEDDFKINNNFAAYYARKWLVLHPEHPEFFKLRASYADDGYWGQQLLRRNGKLPPDDDDDGFDDNGQGDLFR